MISRRAAFGAALAPALGLVSLGVPAAPANTKLEQFMKNLREAQVFYEDKVPNDQYAAYFHGFLQGQGLEDYAIVFDDIGTAGYIADIAVKFERDGSFYHVPLKYSDDYWQRENRPEWLADFNKTYLKEQA